MLVQHLIRILLTLAIRVVHNDDLLLALLVLLLQLLILPTLILNGLNKFALHRRVAWQITHAVVVVFLVVLILMAIIIA